MLMQRTSVGPKCLSRRTVAVVASAAPTPNGGGPREPARPVALPSGTLWMLDAMQDQYYNVRGAAFVIPRVEEREASQETTCARRAKFVRPRSLPARQQQSEQKPSTLSLIYQAMAQEPTSLMFMSDGPLVDTEVESAHVVEPEVSKSASTEQPAVPTGTTCTGIVPVSSTSTDEGEDLYQTSSTSPRRTKMLRFTCLANGCGAVNVKPISPEAFNRGTVFAQCARCNKWHLITDHLSLWDQSKRPVYRNGKRVKPFTLIEVPEALRPAAEDLDFFSNGGRVAGWQPTEGFK